MRVVAIIVRLLLGLAFTAAGVMVFVMKKLPVPPGQPGVFMTVLISSHYLYAIKCFEIAGGLLLLIGKFVPLGLTLIGPVVVNILLYSVFLDRSGLPVAIVVSVLSLFLLVVHRKAFAGLVKP